MVKLTALLFKRRRPGHVLVTLAVAIALPLLIVSLLAATGVVSRLEGYTIDTRFDRRGDLPAPKDIVVVGIDAQTATYFNQWPLSRTLFADAVTHLHTSGAAMIVLDVPFANTSMTGSKAQSEQALARIPAWQRAQIPATAMVSEDDTFVKALAASGPIVVVASKHAALSGLRGPGHANPVAESRVLVGARATPTGPDGVLRSYTVPGSAASAALTALGSGAGAATATATARHTPAHMMLNWYGGPASFEQASFGDVAMGIATTTRSFRNKIVIIGIADGVISDNVHAPLGTMPHATALATALANLRDGTWLGTVSWPRTAAISAGMVFAIWALLEVVALWLAIGLSIALVAGHLALAEHLFARGVVVPVVAPLLSAGLAFLAVVLVLVAASVRERLRIKGLFARYVSPDVVQSLLENEDTIRLGGVEREITVLFSDIRGFTSLSESVDPAEMVTQLNEYFAEMVAVVTAHNGTLDKFLGDGLMAIFGAPVDQDDHAELACAAAVDMLERLKVVNARRAEEQLPALKIGIGMHSGRAVVGNVGSPLFRVDFTAIGDTVNLASRLEALTKELGVVIIASGATVQAAGNAWNFQQRGSVIVTGRTQSTDVFELVTEAAPADVGG